MAYKSRLLYLNDDGDLQEGMGNGVFITDVQPVDPANVVSITWMSDVVGNSVVESIETDTEDLIVTVEWDGSAYHYNGEVEVNGITISDTAEIGDTRRFTGTATIDLNGETLITAIHSDGSMATAGVTLQGAGPAITDVEFTGGYPGSQTEVKENDTFDIIITFDPSGAEPSHVEIQDFGACKTEVIDLSGTELNWGTTHTATVTATIDYTGTSIQALPARVRARNSFGTYGDTLDTNHDGAVDGANTVNCNDTTPTLAFGGIVYTSGFDALKDSETANIEFSYTDTDTVTFTSPTSELSITNDTTLESPKEVTRIAGDYNISTANIQATGHRDANDTTSTVDAVIYIANVPAEITITEPADRLVSGGNDGTTMQNYNITLSSNQLLRDVPTMTAPEGTFGAFSGTVPGDDFVAVLSIHDNDANGTYTWQSLQAENLAGIVTNVITGNDTYEIGGFVERDIYFSPQSMEETLGVNVSDASKLVAVDKDLISMTYYNDLDDHSRGFSITGPSGVLNPTGNILYWNDVTDRENNTTGLSFIRIREDA